MRLALWLVGLAAAASLFAFVHVLTVDSPPVEPASLLHTAHGPPVARWEAQDAAFRTDPTVTPTATATVTPSPSPTPTATPLPPTPTPEPPPPEPTAVYVPPPAETYEEPEPVYTDIEALICSMGWDCATALRVAWCESRYDPNAQNGVHVGIFQMNVNYHSWRSPTGELWTAWANVAAAYHLWAEQGWGPWSCY